MLDLIAMKRRKGSTNSLAILLRFLCFVCCAGTAVARAWLPLRGSQEDYAAPPLESSRQVLHAITSRRTGVLISVGSSATADPVKSDVAYISVVLPIISSLDNLIVGVSLGIGGHDLPVGTNLVIALCNAVGMTVSALVGTEVGKWAPLAAACAAGLFFLCIGLNEIHAWWNNKGGLGEQLAHTAIHRSPWLLAFPMTLNNLATGVAGGLAGANWVVLGLVTFVVSFSLMHFGHVFGRWSGKGLPFSPQLAAGIVFIGLAIWQVAPYAWTATASSP